MIYEDQTNDGQGAAGAAAGGASASDAAAAGGGGDGAGANGDGAGGGDGSAAKQSSLFAQASGAAAAPQTQSGADGAAAGKVTRDASVPAWVPENYKTGEDFAKAHKELTQRMRDVGLPPKTADEYEWKAPEGVQMDETSAKEFREFALENGLSKKQYGAVMTAYVEHLDSLVADIGAITSSKAEATLRKEWKTDEEYKAKITTGYKTLQAFLKPEELKEWDEVNHPAVWRLLERIGTELGEDVGVANSVADISSAEIEASNLRKYDPKSAYWDNKHPDHARTVSRVLDLERAIVARRKRGE